MNTTVAQAARAARRVATVVVAAALALGLTTASAGAATDPSTSDKSNTVSSTECAQLRKRLRGAPATLRRVDANLEELRARLADVRLPARRAALEQRIQRLQHLRTALTTRISDARAACTSTSTT